MLYLSLLQKCRLQPYFFQLQDNMKLIRKYEVWYYTRLESYYIIFYFETDWSRIRPLPKYHLNISVLAQKCGKHAKWRIRDYCNFMWTNTLAISTSSFKVQILVVFQERVFIQRRSESFNGEVTLNKTRKFPHCWPHPLATSIVTPLSTVRVMALTAFFKAH